MGLYLGNSGTRKVILNGAVYRLNLYTKIPITNGMILLSSDDYTLKDSNGNYLTAIKQFREEGIVI
jgi:hypothetical protein